MIDRGKLFETGQFGRPHGVKGEISLVTNFEFPDDDEDTYIVCEMDGIPVPFFVESVRSKSASSILVKFDGIDSEKEVKIFTGKSAFLPDYRMNVSQKERPPFEKAMIGYKVIDRELPLEGVVTQYDDTTANKLLMVDVGGKEIMIPFALSQSVSLDEKAIYVRLPEGFMDI
jgi:16S rRNA processing protein RimM